MRKYLRWPLFIVLAALVVAALVPTLPLLHTGKMAARAVGPSGGQVIPHPAHRPKPLPHHMTAGVNRAHLPTLAMLEGPVQRARTNHAHPNGALMSSSLNTAGTSTLFFDDFESGAPGWTTVGDTYKTPYYPNGHNFWNLVSYPEMLNVPAWVNPNLVSYPNTDGSAQYLPEAYSSSHAWWYGDNPAADAANPAGASITYMGNLKDWPGQSKNDGGTSNGPNTASLISPSIDLTTAPNAVLSFATWWQIESVNPAHFDMMYVEIAVDGSSTWQPLGVLNPAHNPVGGAAPYPYTTQGLDSSTYWQLASVDLTGFVGHHVQVRFRFDSVDQTDNGFLGWLIDDVGVYSLDQNVARIRAVTPDEGMVGNTVTITGTGFGATQGSSSVFFNGFGTTVTAPVQSWGDNKIVVTVPVGAVSGAVGVDVNGVSFRPASFLVNASITLSQSSAVPGATLSVSGKGFVPNTDAVIILDGVQGRELDAVPTDAQGNLPSTPITIPSIQGGSHLLLVYQSFNNDIVYMVTAGATLSIAPSLSTSVGSIPLWQSITVTGQGFAANEMVNVYLDAPANTSFPLGTLNCDASGACSGTMSVQPASPVSQGVYALVGVGATSGLIGQASLGIKPVMTLSVLRGSTSHPIGVGPGTELSVNGYSFAAGETVNIYLGTTKGILEGTRTVDGDGSFFFNFYTPTTLPPGKYFVTVARTNQNPAMLASQFHIVPPQVTVTPGIHSGQNMEVVLKGFQANEQVTLSWNANGGQTLGSVSTDGTGAVVNCSPGDQNNCIVPPAAPIGSYTITATGASSGLKATTSLNVGPGIALSPNAAGPGSTITVNGGGFSVGEKVNVYFQTTANGTVSTTANASGGFSVSLTVPKTYQKNTTYYVHAVGTAGTESVRAQFTFIPPEVYFDGDTVYWGSSSGIYGAGFQPEETINLYWNYHQTGQKKVATLMADQYGRLSGTLKIPSDPNLQQVNYAAFGMSSGLKAVGFVTESPGLAANPGQGAVGSNVHITGGGFSSQEMVTITLNSTTIATVTSDVSGGISTTIMIPTLPSGSYPIDATGVNSGVYGYVWFTVLPTLKISPASGSAGTVITVTGQHFTPNSSTSLLWNDPSVNENITLGSVTFDSNGAFKTTVTAPSGLTSGNTYYIQVFDLGSDSSIQVAFTAQ